MIWHPVNAERMKKFPPEAPQTFSYRHFLGRVESCIEDDKAKTSGNPWGVYWDCCCDLCDTISSLSSIFLIHIQSAGMCPSCKWSGQFIGRWEPCFSSHSWLLFWYHWQHVMYSTTSSLWFFLLNLIIVDFKNELDSKQLKCISQNIKKKILVLWVQYMGFWKSKNKLNNM